MYASKTGINGSLSLKSMDKILKTKIKPEDYNMMQIQTVSSTDILT